METIQALERFAQEKIPLEIHNKALSLLKSDQKDIGFLLLKKNLYQNFFSPFLLCAFSF